MKIRLIYALLALLVVSSCGTISVTKRYHNRGFHLDLSRGGNDNQVAKASVKKRSIKAEAATPVVAEIEESSEIVTTEVGNIESANTSVSSIPADVKETKANNHAVKSKTSVKIAGLLKSAIKSETGIMKTAAKSVKAKELKDAPDGTVMWILYLILCFIIPPLAYYLITRETDALFWICLICFLLWGSYFVGIKFGLLGLISVIIALLALLGS